MKDSQAEFTTKTINEEPEFEGIYGRYQITKADQIEVHRYRLALLICGTSFSAGLGHWILLGPNLAFFWLIPMAISLGLALNWIHIYIRTLHRALQLLWGIGCLGCILMTVTIGNEKVLSTLTTQPAWVLAIGPLFAALTGVGFKEFFCFQRPEAIGLTLLIPIALLGHLSNLLSKGAVMAMLISSALLLLVLALRKFGMDAAADVGDKSVFNHLKAQRTANAL